MKINVAHILIRSIVCVFSAILLVACSSSRLSNVQKGWWGKTNYNGKPWVENVSKPYSLTSGLQGRHLAVWASHGRYYKTSSKTWEWQRPYLFCTTEDLLTQTFVDPYIIPMLENAGANVFMPRERDWQTNEVVIDNDSPQVFSCSDYAITVSELTTAKEYVEEGNWKDCKKPGFGLTSNGLLKDGDLPFSKGTARSTNTTKKVADAFVYYRPVIKEEGDYAVYVSYQTMRNSVDDAHYMVWHGGEMTSFSVNQKMGGGTWVYLGTFHFTTDRKQLNCVVIDNSSQKRGVVTTDAVRFGGGMGNVVRGTKVSGLPRCDEAARYYCQWAGAPYNCYSAKGGVDDYADDINARSLTMNWLAGGSAFVPDREGLKVPVEMSVALHSDAGFFKDFQRVFGSLGICTTEYNNGKLASGKPRKYSTELRDSILNSVNSDMTRLYGKWLIRDHYDKNYAETRQPGVPATILEMFSHQSFPDMKLAHDPTFKFNLSRSVYKAILKFVNQSHGNKSIVSPLAPTNFCCDLSSDGEVTLSWDAQRDELEPTAVSTSYILYIAKGNDDFDNGTIVKGNSTSVSIEPNMVYRFKVAASNDGGISFPSEELSAIYRPGAPTVMVINGFHRLASPQIVDEEVVKDSVSGEKTRFLGFDISKDPGVSYGRTAGWCGNQVEMNIAKASNDAGKGIYGYSDNSLEGKIVAGNDFNYVTTHIRAISQAGGFSAVSCSSSALDKVSLDDYAVVDLILGNERNDGYSLAKAKALPKELIEKLRKYHGALFVSGSYIGSDSKTDEEKKFLNDVLHLAYKTQNRDGKETIHGMGLDFDVYRNINAKHYASTSSDVLEPVNDGFAAMRYDDYSYGAIAFNKGLRKSFAMGFPFECIKKESFRSSLMKGILTFLTEDSNKAINKKSE